ncbi:MAG TPA: DUF6470 family protein [Syntrophomonadaceae bacterium]|nr:DUF6470 family protein [Syntrophomonadaceae bacterium]
MLQIRIDQQFAKIGLDIQKPFLGMRTIHPKIELNIEKPQLEIHSPRPKIYIDQTQCFADMDKRTPSAFSEHWAGIARSKAFEAIGIISSEGDMLGQIENGITLEDLAASAMDTQVDFNVTAVPKQPPKIDFDTRPVQIHYQKGKVNLHLNRGRVENHFEQGKINAYIRQQNYLNITWEQTLNHKA